MCSKRAVRDYIHPKVPNKYTLKTMCLVLANIEWGASALFVISIVLAVFLWIGSKPIPINVPFQRAGCLHAAQTHLERCSHQSVISLERLFIKN